LLTKADREWSRYQDVVQHSLKSKEIYFDLKMDVEQLEIQLEEAMLAYERGQLAIDRVKIISSHAATVKYRTEEAT